MERVYLSLGSNIDRERHLCAGLDALKDRFGRLTLSPVYESEAVGFDGDPFFNLVVGINTDLGVGDLSRIIKAIEDANGRVRNGPKFSGRTLDIDILTYGSHVGIIDGIEIPRDEILKHAFVLLPLANIAADELHPVCHKSYAKLWTEFDKSAQSLWLTTLPWPSVAAL